ncbi:hypothetical protein K6W76_32155, partial [Burkholderia anthina]|uniref:hypothetical protein n=2 Tax=Burkholderia TaxID=32008 RepID=UPI001C97A3CB
YLRRPGSTAEPGVTQQNCRAVKRIHVICESGLNPVDGYFNGLLSIDLPIGLWRHAPDVKRRLSVANAATSI